MKDARDYYDNGIIIYVKQLMEWVSDMLGWKKSLAYLPAGGGYGRTTAFHIAASEGDILMIQELLHHCPDCWDMVNGGQNALHIEILNHQEMLVNAFLESTRCNSLVCEADDRGNTPLHFLAANWNHLPKLVLDHPRAKKVTYNNRNETPLDITLSDPAWTINKEKLAADLCSINGRLGQRDFQINRKTETMREEEEKAKRDKIETEKIMNSAQIQKVVATLVLTVTFVAGFTLAGGLESDDGPNKGTVILLKRAVFPAFVISDVLAFIFIYFSMADINIGLL